MTALPLDAALAAVTLWVAWRALSDEDLFVSVVLFIAFGLLMSLLWVRLGAEDIALAEATIGAGITGALLLDAVRAVSEEERSGVEPERPPRRTATATTAVITAALAGVLALAVVELPDAVGGLTRRVMVNLDDVGVHQPVTAVLIGFRGYDTLLETGVLLLAGLGLLAVARTRDVGHGAPGPVRNVILQWLVRLLLPVLALTAGHLLLLGTRGAGGGFQSGALLAAAAILLMLAGGRSVAQLSGAWLRVALLSGLAVFVAVGVSPMPGGGRFLELRAPAASTLILLVEAALAAATAITLAALFAGARPRPAPAGEPAARGHARAVES